MEILRFVSAVAVLAFTALLVMYVANGEQAVELGLPEGFPAEAEAAVE